MDKYIIVKALTNSEWDNVSFALIPINDKYLKYLKQLAFRAVELSKEFEYQFYCIKCWEDNYWYVNEEDDDKLPKKISEFLSSDKEWDFINLNDKDLFPLNSPESKLEAGTVRICAGDVKWTTRNTGDEEFWTEAIPYKELFNEQPLT